MKGIITIVGSLGLLLCSALATAGHIDCTTAEIDAFHTGATGCAIGHENNDKINPLQVNVDEMFGHDDWVYGGKFKYGADAFSAGAIDYTSEYFIEMGMSSKTAGIVTFADTLNALFPNMTDAMIVLKGGNGGTTQENYIGYTLDLTLDEFAWNSPFFNDKKFDENGNPYILKDISHWTLYGRGDDTFVVTNEPPPTDVPEPAMAGLFALGVAGLVLRRRRKTTEC